METFDSIWRTSAQNPWANGFPIVIAIGITIICCLSWIRNPFARWASMISASFILAGTATAVSFQSITEKWSIRHEWTEKNWDVLTEQQQSIATTDGANLVLGAPINGLCALICFVVSILIISIVRRPGWGSKRSFK